MTGQEIFDNLPNETLRAEQIRVHAEITKLLERDAMIVRALGGKALDEQQLQA